MAEISASFSCVNALRDMLRMNEILRFGNCNTDSRNFTEGEDIISANQVILCGSHDPNPHYWKIYALVLQTSALSSEPHLIEGKIVKKDVTIKEFTCSCKAGLSECCKHVLAVLHYCHRKGLSSLELLSTTDKACLWKARKEKALDEYKARPLLTFHCFSMKKTPDLKQLMAKVNVKDTLDLCLSELPDCAFAKHARGRDNSIQLPFSPEKIIVHTCKPDIRSICNNANNNYMLWKLASHDVGDIPSCCREFYVMNVVTYNSFSLCLETSTDKSQWHSERQFRITASRCYALYTYQGHDWETKSEKYFFPKTFSTKATRFGLQFEPVARQAYCRHVNCEIIECGLVVNESNPWLAVSPDGVIMCEGKPKKLVEIKCPVEGQLSSITEVLPKCKFMVQDSNGRYTVNKKHQYYAQMILGMAVLNIQECDFIIFCAKDESMFIETVILDVTFCIELLQKLKDIYFQKMLHNICKRNM